jgi:hypothetical protein
VNPIPYSSDHYPGRYFNVTLSNNDCVPILLKLGAAPKLKENDTLHLSRTYNCNNNDGTYSYYDLHDLKERDISCIKWYALQLIRPAETIRFVVKLHDFDTAAPVELLYCYTREITSQDITLEQYAEKNTTILRRDIRAFETIYLKLNRETRKDSLFITLNSSQSQRLVAEQ